LKLQHFKTKSYQVISANYSVHFNSPHLSVINSDAILRKWWCWRSKTDICSLWRQHQ